MGELHKLSLREIVTGIGGRRWSAAEVLRAHAARIEALEPQIQAWEHLDLERAARRASALAEGSGALHGAPIAVKDIIDVEGMPTRFGSPIYASAGPAFESAECVQALERAGGIVLGKSVTTEFAYYTARKTRNPWNPRHTPGGSSMGSAAAVACGMSPGALGTQTNGSVIRPAAFCGIVGFKPSYGTVSNHGTLDPWPTLDHTGVFARSVGDAALLASVVAKPGAVSAAVRLPAHPLRLALVQSPVWHLAETAQRETLAAAATTLTHAGAAVESVELGAEFGEAHRMHRSILAYEGARHFRDLQQRFRDGISDQLNDLLDAGAGITDREYGQTLDAAKRLRQSYAKFFASYDAIITPPAPGEAPARLDYTGDPAFCTIWTLLGAPAITIPVGKGPAGLPLGLQIIGPRLEDDRLLGVAAWCEAHLPFKRLS